MPDHFHRRSSDESQDDVWAVSSDADGLVELTLLTGPPRPLVATLSETELAGVANMLSEVADAVRRGEFSRIQLGAAFRSAIGRDPFKLVTGAPPRRGLFTWWIDLVYVVIGLGFVADHSDLLLRIAGWTLTTVALADLVRHGWRRLRSRRPQRANAPNRS